MSTVTKTIHKTTYPSISPTKNPIPGKTILITGSSSGIGYAIASSAAAASASRILILGRRADVVSAAVSKLQDTVPSGSDTKVLSYPTDIADPKSVDELFEELDREGVEVDILVLNAGRTDAFELTKGTGAAKKTWDMFDMNVRANQYMAEKFMGQGPETGKVLLNISSGAAHVYTIPKRAVYGASKAAFACLLQGIAYELPASTLQVLSIHPGMIYTEAAAAAGFPKEGLPWDDVSLPGDFVIWASTPAAAFLHGRFVWAAWDVEELEKQRGKFESDKGYCTIGLQGVETITPPGHLKRDT